MVGWTFENALEPIQSPPSMPFTILLSTDGLRLGDIHFAKIQMTLGMWTVTIMVLVLDERLASYSAGIQQT